jgi:predicted phage baseplate assembly protein
LSLAVPSLDTRTYDDLIAEAKQRIPRYVPEWTDFNESDPGMVLVELFAWMTEAVLYQLNQAPAVLQLKLLQLLGFETRPAQPATTELQFTLNPGIASTIVPALTQVQASGATYADGSPVVFETDSSVVAIAPALAGVVATQGSTSILFYGPNNPPPVPPAAPFVPFPKSVAANELDAMYLCFSYGDAFPSVDVDLAIFLQDAPGDTGSYTCTFGKAPVPPAQWVWEYIDSTKAWVSVNLLSDGTSALYRSGHVQFSFPTAPVSATPFSASSDPRLTIFNSLTTLPTIPPTYAYWVRARLISANYEQAPSIAAITTNTAPATAAQTVTNEVVGASTGMASQQFALAHSPVLASTLVLAVDEGLAGGATTWTQVPDFYGYGPDDTVYTLDATTGTITFGDNHYGAIPLPNAANPTNITATTYRYGGGAAGNVPIGSITAVQSYVAYVASVTNPVDAQDGADEETQADAIMRSAADIRSTNRAVTADDFSALALETPGALVARACALPLTDPAFLGIEVAGSVTVIVVPHRQEDDDPSLQTAQTGPPEPNQTTLEAVCAWLDAHRLVTTQLFVIGPTYRTLTFDVTVYCSVSADLAAVSQQVRTVLRALYAPAGNGAGWTWGATAYAAVAFAAIMNVAGVTRVDTFTMSLDGVALPTLGDAVIGANQLFWVPVVGGVTVTPRYDTST